MDACLQAPFFAAIIADYLAEKRNFAGSFAGVQTKTFIQRRLFVFVDTQQTETQERILLLVGHVIGTLTYTTLRHRQVVFILFSDLMQIMHKTWLRHRPELTGSKPN